jgi:hypothetical protein
VRRSALKTMQPQVDVSKLPLLAKPWPKKPMPL